MKFNSRIAMESRPDFHLDGVLAPLGFDASLHGGCHATLDSVSLTVGEVPIRLAIPFLKRRRPPVFVSIGRFKATLGPLRLTTEGMHFELKGVVGTDGIRGEAKGGVDCETEMRVDGDIRGQAGKLTVEFDEAEDSFEFSEHTPHGHEEPEHEKPEAHEATERPARKPARRQPKSD